MTRRPTPGERARVSERSKTWEVTVAVDGEEVLTIGHNFLSGVPNIDDYAHEVRTCAQHLLSFIGPEQPAPARDNDTRTE